MIIGPLLKFHGTRDILRSLSQQAYKHSARPYLVSLIAPKALRPTRRVGLRS
jgi:hypothetical protein